MVDKSAKTREITVQIAAIQRLERAMVRLNVLGISPLVMNRMPAKAKQQLLLPRRMLNKAARESVLKHNPPEEYRDSIYKCRDDAAPTYVHIPNGAFKKAMAQAAVDTPGATKAETGRLVKVLDVTVHLFGKPYLYMDVVRQAGISHTPDIRTRAMFPEWACQLTVQYIRTRIREQDIINLMANAGDITGIGDGRTEKGTFDYGSWELVDSDDKRWREIVKTQGRKVQLAAMEKPEAIDEDTEELLAWYHAEIIRREQEPTTLKSRKRKASEDVFVVPLEGGNGSDQAEGEA